MLLTLIVILSKVVYDAVVCVRGSVSFGMGGGLGDFFKYGQ